MSIKLEDVAFYQLSELNADELNQTLQSDAAMVLNGNTDAFEAAKNMWLKKAAMIAVTDDAGEVKGVVFPNWIRAQVREATGVNPGSFQEALEAIKEIGDENAREYGGEPVYHHEWLNQARPATILCPKGGGHLIDSEPCPYHG